MKPTIEIQEAVSRLCDEYIINKNNKVTSIEMSKIERHYYDMFSHPKSVKERYDEEINLIKKQEAAIILATQESVRHPPFLVPYSRYRDYF